MVSKLSSHRVREADDGHEASGVGPRIELGKESEPALWATAVSYRPLRGLD